MHRPPIETSTPMLAANRRAALIVLAALGVMPSSAQAQPRSVRLGALVGRRNSSFWPPLLKRLSELGYAEGKNLTLDYRSADGVVERFPVLARELIEAKCDLIFAIGAAQSAASLLEAKSPIPVVFIANDYDPVKPPSRRPGNWAWKSCLRSSARRRMTWRARLPPAARAASMR